MSIVQSGLLMAMLLPFLLALWIAFVHRRGAVVYNTAVETGQADPTDVRCRAACADLDVVLRDALVALSSLAHSRWTRIELAVGAPMVVSVNEEILRAVLGETVTAAINAVSGGRVLITDAMCGGQVHIRITDDGSETGAQFRETLLRETGELIALQGGSLSVEAHPGHGTTVTISVPAPNAADQPTEIVAHLPVLAA